MQILWISVTVALSDTYDLDVSTIPSLLYQAHQRPQGSLRFSSATFSVFLVLGLCTVIIIIIIIVISIIIIISIIIVIIIIIIIIIGSPVTVCADVLFVHQLGANHTPGASVTQVNHSVYTLSTFLRIRSDPSVQIFWISAKEALSDTFLMFSTIPFFTVPSAPTTTRIISVFICHILCISSARSLYLLFFSIAFSAMFLSDRIVISISLQVELTESLTMMSGLFAMIVMLLSLLCVTVSGLYSYHLLPELHARACAEPHSQENLSILENLVITWPYNERPTDDRRSAPQAYQCKICQSTGMATQMRLEVILAGNRIPTRVL